MIILLTVVIKGNTALFSEDPLTQAVTHYFAEVLNKNVRFPIQKIPLKIRSHSENCLIFGAWLITITRVRVELLHCWLFQEPKHPVALRPVWPARHPVLHHLVRTRLHPEAEEAHRPWRHRDHEHRHVPEVRWEVGWQVRVPELCVNHLQDVHLLFQPHWQPR